MEQSRSLVWHPSVHAQFRDELVFALLKVTAFPKDDVYRKLEQFLERTKHTTFRIYRVLGTVDIILRVWVETNHAEEFMVSLQREVDYIESGILLTVSDIPHHWQYWRTPTPESLSNLTPDAVASLQQCFLSPKSWGADDVVAAIDKLLVRQVTETPNTVMFFTGLPLSGVRRLDTQILLKEIYDLFDQFKGLEKTAVYCTRGDYAFLIKAETKDFFLVGSFLNELSHKISVNKCGTVTSVVADCHIRGREEIGVRSFRQVESRDRSTSIIIPEVYDDRTVNADTRAAIESWVRNNLVPHRPDMTEDNLKSFQICLRAIIARDEGAFLSQIVGVYGKLERPLRQATGMFVGKLVGPNLVGATIQEALRHVPGSEHKKMDQLALGDRLCVFVHVIKKAKLSDDPEVVGDWGPEVGLRDQAAHFSENPFQTWGTQLALLIRFLNRYRKLWQIIDSTRAS